MLESVLGTFETIPKRSKVSGSASETPAKTARAPSHLQQIDNQVARNPHLSLILYNNCVFIAHYIVWLWEIPLLSLILHNICVKYSSLQAGPSTKTPSTPKHRHGQVCHQWWSMIIALHLFDFLQPDWWPNATGSWQMIMMMMMAMMVMMRNWKRLSLILYNNCAFIAHYMVWLREIPLL